MYSFKNFVYQDQDGEMQMNESIRELCDHLFKARDPIMHAKFIKDWPHQGMNATNIQEPQIEMKKVEKEIST